MKKIRRIRMTTRTSKLVVVQSKTASPEAAATAAAGADGHSHAEICPTCGQPLLFLPPAPAAIEPTPLLTPPAAATTAAVCLNEHEADET